MNNSVSDLLSRISRLVQDRNIINNELVELTEKLVSKGYFWELSDKVTQQIELIEIKPKKKDK